MSVNIAVVLYIYMIDRIQTIYIYIYEREVLPWYIIYAYMIDRICCTLMNMGVRFYRYNLAPDENSNLPLLVTCPLIHTCIYTYTIYST